MYPSRPFPLASTLVLGLFACLFPRPCSGQASPDGNSGAAAAELVKNVDEVSLDFVISNKKMASLGLQPEDIEVTDDGTTVKLTGLHLVTKQSGTNHLVTLLFDPLGPSAATNAREVSQKILKVIPTEDFSFSVFNTDSRLRLLQEFTNDREKIQRAINLATNDSDTSRDQAASLAERQLPASLRSGTGQATTQTSAFDVTMRRAVLASLAESRRIAQDQRGQAGLAGMLALVHAQTQIPGRKLLVYFTDGSQTDANEQDMARSIAAAADRAEVTIFVMNSTAVDTKLMEGLIQSQAMGAWANSNRPDPAPTGPGGPRLFAGGMVPAAATQEVRVQGEGLAGNHDALSDLATHTGGAHLFSEDNLKKPFSRAVADLTTYYEATYLPPAQAYDGKFHQITVKPRRKGLKVKARAGYFAVPPATGVRPFEMPLLKLFDEKKLPADLPFKSAVFHLGAMVTGNENTLVVEVPISGLATHSDPNANLLSWHLAVVSQIKDKSGAVVEHFSEDNVGHAALDGKEPPGCVTMQRHFALSPGDYTLETAIADHNSGKLSAKRVPLQVPDSSSGAFLSDVALVRRVDPYPEELDPFEPLRYREGKVVPNISEQVTPEAKESSFFFLVHPDSTASQPAMLEMQVARNGELIGQVPLQLPQDLGDAFPYVASLRTSSMPPGNYDITVSLTQGGKVLERELSFRIRGAESASAKLAKTPPVEAMKPSDTVTDSDSGAPEIASVRRQPLVITALPAAARPSDDELKSLIEGAQNHALTYTAKLPNFACLELTERSVDPSGNGKWRRKDSFGEVLRYLDNHETRKIVEVNGRASSIERSDLKGPLSLGEFGVLMGAVFRPASHADFHWKETDSLGEDTVQVFAYHVDPKNDSMALTDSNGRVYTGYHGLVYIDGSTFGIRRITMEAEGIPTDFSIRETSITVDYDYVSVGSHEYLMPIRGTIRIGRGRHEVDLNQIVFQDYRRFASQAKIVVHP